MGHKVRTVLITGAAGGVGRELVSQFAGGGDRVIAVDFDGPGIEELSQWDGVRGIQADVSKLEDVQKAVTAAGQVDVLVNNAGVIDRLGTVIETEQSEWQRLMDIN